MIHAFLSLDRAFKYADIKPLEIRTIADLRTVECDKT